MAAGTPARDARAVAARALAARMPVRPSSIAIDTKMKLSVSAPTLTRYAAPRI
jgi:hypothetical protein